MFGVLPGRRRGRRRSSRRDASAPLHSCDFLDQSPNLLIRRVARTANAHDTIRAAEALDAGRRVEVAIAAEERGRRETAGDVIGMDPVDRERERRRSRLRGRRAVDPDARQSCQTIPQHPQLRFSAIVQRGIRARQPFTSRSVSACQRRQKNRSSRRCQRSLRDSAFRFPHAPETNPARDRAWEMAARRATAGA
jgi:hypothetical protein